MALHVDDPTLETRETTPPKGTQPRGLGWMESPPLSACCSSGLPAARNRTIVARRCRGSVTRTRSGQIRRNGAGGQRLGCRDLGRTRILAPRAMASLGQSRPLNVSPAGGIKILIRLYFVTRAPDCLVASAKPGWVLGWSFTLCRRSPDGENRTRRERCRELCQGQRSRPRGVTRSFV